MFCLYLPAVTVQIQSKHPWYTLQSDADDIIQNLYSSEIVKLRCQVSIYYTILAKSLACLSCQSCLTPYLQQQISNQTRAIRKINTWHTFVCRKNMLLSWKHWLHCTLIQWEEVETHWPYIFILMVRIQTIYGKRMIINYLKSVLVVFQIQRSSSPSLCTTFLHWNLYSNCIYKTPQCITLNINYKAWMQLNFEDKNGFFPCI